LSFTQLLPLALVVAVPDAVALPGRQFGQLVVEASEDVAVARQRVAPAEKDLVGEHAEATEPELYLRVAFFAGLGPILDLVRPAASGFGVVAA
jgi:hypothetical protein